MFSLNFEEFCSDIAENIYNYLPEQNIESVKIEKVCKNNGVECTGLVVILVNENVAPNIYLDYFYMLYKQGRNLDDILSMISEEYRNAKNSIRNTNFDIDLTNLKENIIIKLVNYEKNKDKLCFCPHIKYLDLAITFRYLVRLDEKGLASAMIKKSDIDKWNITLEELYDMALYNTKRLFPPKIRCMDEIIDNFDDMCIQEQDKNILYILSNEAGINGASCILYQDVIKEFATMKGSGVYIMPSSIHEVIMVSSEYVEKERLCGLVKEVNKFIVSELEYLSDNVYFYDLETDKITI